MSSQPVDRLHPVAGFARGLSADLDSLADVPLWSMPTDQLLDTSKSLAKDRAQLDAMQLQVLAELERRGATTDTGAASAADWIAVETRQVRRDAKSDLKLAQALQGYDLLSAAMAEGRVNKAQARAIVASLDKLPTTGEFAVDTQQRLEAETYLVAQAEHHDAKALRILGGRIFEVIAPDLAEKYDGQALEKEEAEALRRTTLTMFEDDEGTYHGRFRIPALHGQMLQKMILAISSPSRSTHDNLAPSRSGIDPDLPTPVRHGIALIQLIETYPAKDLPQTGGCSATVVVTMTLDQLLADLDHAGVCILDTGGRIRSPSTSSGLHRRDHPDGPRRRRQGGLDVGRRRRLHTEADAPAMAVRDTGCTAEVADPAGQRHVHHDQPWSQGGHTNVGTGRLLCPAPPPQAESTTLRTRRNDTRRQGQLPPAGVRGSGRPAHRRGWPTPSAERRAASRNRRRSRAATRGRRPGRRPRRWRPRPWVRRRSARG